jgi:hypothetical protein
MKQLRTERRKRSSVPPRGKSPRPRWLITALADTFSVGESVELSDGEKTTRKSQFEVLGDLIDSLPPLVRPGKLDLSDGEEEKPVDLAKLKGKI